MLLDPVIQAIEIICQTEPALRVCTLRRELLYEQMSLIAISPCEEVAKHIFARRGRIVEKTQSLSLAKRLVIFNNDELFACCSSSSIPFQARRSLAEEAD